MQTNIIKAMDNSLLSRFTPREPKFFVYLNQMSVLFTEAAELMLEALQVSSSEGRRDFFVKIKEKEHAADMVSHTIFNALEESFITPFDREDIHALADRLDDAIDLLNSSAKRLSIYNVTKTLPSFIELGKIIVEASKIIQLVVNNLGDLHKKSTEVKEGSEQIHALENRGDEIYEAAITQLFIEETNAIELVKNKEILSHLEKVTDAADRIGKVLKTILVKYS
ncbi:DUF47 domain-containing protein [Porphyromonas sp.]|uniref:DUF47 domain-containing protein n=1 Tax=Porphyromonas sp. TaxID=1924944 RepID=UPI002A75C2CB|nr:DUF47 family protein [Porphyromonas sp.]